MKIISRGVGEQVAIDDHTTVTVLKIDDERIILSITSSLHSPAYREEIISLKKSEFAPSLQAVTR